MDCTCPTRCRVAESNREDGVVKLNDRLRRRSQREEADERERLGWLRQPAVRWLDPGILAREALQVAISYAFGKLADKREIQDEAQDEPFDYSESGKLADRDELWLDFLSDTGDGWEATQTMAWLLAKPELTGPDGEPLRRGDLLLLGGDQVYPSASPVAYEDHFIGPFSAASREAAPERELFAIPGNHDWYDGLVSFLRVFCRPSEIGVKAIGGWATRQTRSYWALKLRRGWWLWATDIQLDTWIDSRQLRYFHRVGKELRPGDQVILITAKPSWVKVRPDRPAPESWDNLAYFEREMIAARDARLTLVLTGDLHHYARYEPESAAAEAPVRLTAGGGGAYLSPTHTLPDSLELTTEPEKDPVRYMARQIYPRAEHSRRLRWGILKLPLGTPPFGLVMGAIYALLGAAALGALSAGGAGIVEGGTADGISGFIDRAIGGAVVVLAVLLAGLLVAYADLPRRTLKLVAGLAHALIHVALAGLTLYLILLAFSEGAPGVVVWIVALIACFGVGFLAGSFVFAAVLLATHVGFGREAPRHTNEVFAGQAIADYKNFLRLRLDRDGTLTVYPFGVDRICRDWELLEDDVVPRFAPRDSEPEATLIDDPLSFPPPR
jgi:hypothetical protein